MVVLARLLRPWWRPVVVEGLSMVPTYAPGEVLWARRRFRPLRVGDVVVVPAPTGQGEWLKRVVAVSGDAVTLAGDNPAVSTDSRHVGPVPRRSCRWRLGRSDLR